VSLQLGSEPEDPVAAAFARTSDVQVGVALVEPERVEVAATRGQHYCWACGLGGLTSGAALLAGSLGPVLAGTSAAAASGTRGPF
jgi:hypothetical protein